MFGSPRSAGPRTGASRWFAFATLVLAVLFARPARADRATTHAVAVAVLGLESDDAEDQADALTGALRSRIRASEGWSLAESPRSLGMLIAALRCTKPLSTECKEKIGEQLKVDRFIFGWVRGGPQQGEVVAEIHLHQRGKPDAVVRESYSDNLKDQNDDTLRAVAQRIVDRLGQSAVGTILVEVGADGGEVVIDGAKHVAVSGGTARILVSPGSHSVEVVVPGQPSRKQNILVTAGKQTVVDLSRNAAPVDAPTPESARPFPVRTVVGATLVAGGLAAGVVSVLSAVAYADDEDRAKANEADPNPNILKLPIGKRPGDVCDQAPYTGSDICRIDASARRHSIVAITTGVGAGLLLVGGAYLLLTDGGSSASGTTGAAPKRSATIAPSFGYGSGGAVLSGTF